jgi:methionyl aminopeptidase
MSRGSRRPRGVTVKTPEQVRLMRAAGLVVGRTLDRLAAAVRPGVTTGQLDALAEEAIRAEGALPSFLGYHGFTGSICASVGAEVVHGIPRPDRVLAEGELISIDCGAILAGWHGDAAITVPVGECAPELLQLSEVTERAMWAGLAAVRPGGRLSDVGAAVEAAVRPYGYGLLEGYTGHGIGTSMHEPPYVPNTAPDGPGRGMALEPGIVLAVEPMVTLGSPDVTELDDGWTVVTLDGRAAAHWEHTVAVTPDGPQVLTALDSGVAGLAAVSGVTGARRLDQGAAGA